MGKFAEREIQPRSREDREDRREEMHFLATDKIQMHADKKSISAFHLRSSD
jgi:hypothetical protein